MLVANLVAGAVGGIAWLRSGRASASGTCCASPRRRVVLQVLLGTILLLLGHEAPTACTTSTACCRCVVALLAEAVRAGAAERELEGLDFDRCRADRQRSFALAIVRRETGIMAVSALVVFVLALRAAGTSGDLFCSASTAP